MEKWGKRWFFGGDQNDIRRPEEKVVEDQDQWAAANNSGILLTQWTWEKLDSKVEAGLRRIMEKMRVLSRNALTDSLFPRIGYWNFLQPV